MREGRIGEAEVRLVDAARMDAVATPLVAANPFLLLLPRIGAREQRRYDEWRSNL